MTLWLKHRWKYIAIKEDCDIRGNIGAISTLPNDSGCLNFRKKLRRMPPFNSIALNPPPKPKGEMHSGEGSGYVGWIDLGSVRNAIAFIANHVAVQYCPIGCVITAACGAVVPCPPIERPGAYWKQLQKQMKSMRRRGMEITSVVFRGGGTDPVPGWFRKWCAANNIEIRIIDDQLFDREWRPETWTDNKGESYIE
jgi:hypothetical protein